MDTPLEVCMLQDKCELPPLEGTKALKMRLGRGEDKFSHTQSPIWESFATSNINSQL